MGDSLLKMVEVYKTFDGTIRALQGANLTVEKGEIHALLGENAAGKSTLMNILYGGLRADSGTIYINGKKENISFSSDAIALGIGMVHQHFKLVQDFTVLENVILGQEYRFTNHLGKVDYAKAQEAVQIILDQINEKINLQQITSELSIGAQSKVEIVKSLFRGAKLLILDEPTTVLAPTEVESFFAFLRTLRDSGCTMIYISHRMNEIFDLTDSITVLRHGKDVLTCKTTDTSMEEISALMIGREVEERREFVPSPARTNEPVLDIRNLEVGGPSPLSIRSITVHRGEIVGIAGIEGNGQEMLEDILIGSTLLDPSQKGVLTLLGTDVGDKTPGQRRRTGLRFVPDDRLKKGLAVNLSLTKNAIAGHQHEDNVRKKGAILDWVRAGEYTYKMAKDYCVEGFFAPEQPLSSLSGGNMQKLLVGRELTGNPPVTVLCQPTVGIDFLAQRHIHEMIFHLRDIGGAFLLISADLDELISISDRILVIYRGRIVADFSDRSQFDEKELGYYMTGVKGNEDSSCK